MLIVGQTDVGCPQNVSPVTTFVPREKGRMANMITNHKDR